MAIQYGMSPDQFWFGDMRLFEAYQKAYIRNISYMAWANGIKVMEANTKSLYNSLGREKKTDPCQTMGDWDDPVKTLYKEKISIKDAEKEFRKEQLKQANWFSEALKNN